MLKIKKNSMKYKDPQTGEMKDVGIVIGGEQEGSAVTDKQIAQAVEDYLTENPIEVEVPTKVSELKNDANYVTDEVFKPTKQKADEALIVAKGAQRAFVYDDYEEMQTSGDLLSKATSIIGKNILIRKLNVPDLWISGVLDPDSHYPYEDIYSDEEILDELEHNGYIAIGYCMLSRLETQKVYLDEYLRKDEIDLDYFATKDDLDNIYIPGSTSELDNDSGFITSDDVPTKTSDLINDSFVESPTTAEVGQMLVVKAVDENGVPTEWEVSDVASGDGASSASSFVMEITLEEEVTGIVLELPAILDNIKIMNIHGQLTITEEITLYAVAGTIVTNIGKIPASIDDNASGFNLYAMKGYGDNIYCGFTSVSSWHNNARPSNPSAQFNYTSGSNVLKLYSHTGTPFPVGTKLWIWGVM